MLQIPIPYGLRLPSLRLCVSRHSLGPLRSLRDSGFALGQPDRFATGESRSAWSLGLLRPLRGSTFGLGQPDDFVAGASPHGSRPPSRGGYARDIKETPTVGKEASLTLRLTLRVIQPLTGRYVSCLSWRKLGERPQWRYGFWCGNAMFCAVIRF